MGGKRRRPINRRRSRLGQLAPLQKGNRGVRITSVVSQGDLTVTAGGGFNQVSLQALAPTALTGLALRMANTYQEYKINKVNIVFRPAVRNFDGFVSNAGAGNLQHAAPRICTWQQINMNEALPSSIAFAEEMKAKMHPVAKPFSRAFTPYLQQQVQYNAIAANVWRPVKCPWMPCVNGTPTFDLAYVFTEGPNMAGTAVGTPVQTWKVEFHYDFSFRRPNQ